MYRKYIKRLLDIIISFCALVILSPILLIVAILVRIKLGSPVIFCQERPGKDEKIFKLYKFRTMTNKTDENGKLLPDSERLTKFGKILRSTSLDELPELWNILKGDMSLIGPRPLTVSYLQYYNEKEKHRHDVRPGLTGLAQVNGRNALNWDDRFAYDIEYVKNITLINDIKIIFKTVYKVLKRDGVVTRGTGKTVDFSTYRKKQLETVKEIGSDFYEYDSSKNDKTFEPFKQYKSRMFFQSGRNAIKALCKSINSANKKVLLPAYTCETVIEPFVEENFEVYFYTINKDFSIDENDFMRNIKSINPSIILIQSYFGFDTLKNSNKIIDKLIEEGITIIEDITHNWINELEKTKVQYYIASLRKWFAIPDGGVLISNQKELDISYEDRECNKLIDISIEAYKLKKEYIKCNDNEELKKQYREKYSTAREIISKTKNLTPMSNVSKNIFSNFNLEEIANKRKENYKYLYDNLNNKYQNIKVIKKIDDREIPLYFPIYIEQNRSDLIQELIENKIYCPVIWPKSKYINESYSQTDYIYEHILCIPCDQRYNLEDMKRIIENIDKVCEN